MPKPQAELIARLKNDYPPSTTGFGQLLLLNDVPNAFSFTSADVTAATGTFTIPGHTYTDAGSGTRVRYPAAAPGGLTLNRDYWVRNVIGDDFQISIQPGDSPIGSFSSAGTGTMTVEDQRLSPIDQVLLTPDSNTVQWVRKETNYQGSGRLDFDTPADASYVIVSVLNVLRAKFAVTFLFDNSAGVAGLEFNKVLLITGGSLTVGDPTGTVKQYWNNSQMVAAGESLNYILTAFDSNFTAV